MLPHRAILIALLALPGCIHFATPGKTVQGPEADTLLPATTGFVLMDRKRREITAIELPSLRETIIRPTRPKDPNDDPVIHALSGPDNCGRIAYIEDHFFVEPEKNRRHLLKTINLDGTQERELFSRPGDAMWARRGEIGSYLALSPVGGRVAFVSTFARAQMPSALLRVGSLEIWDLEKGTGDKQSLDAVDHRLSWFPDGKRLAYVKLIESKSAAGWDETFGKEFRSWDKVPCVFVRDVAAGTEAFLHVGYGPIVSFDGRSVFFSDEVGSYRSVDVATGKSRAITWSGTQYDGAIAMTAHDVLLACCLPTEGAKIKYTESNSPLSGPKQMLALKLLRLNSVEFQTVAPYIDPRDVRARISFGRGTVRDAER